MKQQHQQQQHQRLALPKPSKMFLNPYKLPSPSQSHRRNFTERDSSLSSRLTPTNEQQPLNKDKTIDLTSTFSKHSICDNDFKPLNERVNRLEEHLSKLELAQDSVRPMIKQLQQQSICAPQLSARQPSPMMRMSVQPQSADSKQQLEQLKQIVDNQIKANSKVVRVAIDEGKKAHFHMRQELTQIREQCTSNRQHQQQQDQHHQIKEINEYLGQLQHKLKEAVGTQNTRMSSLYEKIDQLQRNQTQRIASVEDRLNHIASFNIENIQSIINQKVIEQSQRVEYLIQDKQTATTEKKTHESVQQSAAEANKHVRRPSQMPLQSRNQKSFRDWNSPNSIKQHSVHNSVTSLNHFKPQMQQLQAVELLSSQQLVMINDKIQSLIGCVESNSAGLQNSLNEIKEAAVEDQTDLENYGSQLAHQFNMFYQYVQEQAATIRELIDQSNMQVDNNLQGIEDFLSKRPAEEPECEELSNQLLNVKKTISGPRESQSNSLLQIEERMKQLHAIIQGEIQELLQPSQYSERQQANITDIQEEGGEYLNTDEIQQISEESIEL